jgi:di/tricarboxylate transporter
MAEVMLTATSDLAGKTVVESKFRTRFGLTMIGLRHGDTAQDGNLQDEKLGIGDFVKVGVPFTLVVMVVCVVMVPILLPLYK